MPRQPYAVWMGVNTHWKKNTHSLFLSRALALSHPLHHAGRGLGSVAIWTGLCAFTVPGVEETTEFYFLAAALSGSLPQTHIHMQTPAAWFLHRHLHAHALASACQMRKSINLWPPSPRNSKQFELAYAHTKNTSCHEQA